MTSRPRTRISGFFFSLLALCVALSPRSAFAWDDEGHRIIALVADQFLVEAAFREKITAMLAADPDNLAAHDIASAATWADWYRDSDHNGAASITSKRGVGTSSTSSLMTRTLTQLAMGTRRYRPARLPRIAQPKNASSIRSSNSRQNSPIPELISRNGLSR
jgi:hypothetical protein